MPAKLSLPAAEGMKSLPRVFKASEVFVDQDKVVQIKANIDIPPPFIDESNLEEVQQVTPQDLIRNTEKEAEQILLSANNESKAIIAKAQKDSAALIAEAETRMAEEGQRIYEEKRQEGYAQGMSDATAEGTAIKTEAQNVLDAAYREQDELRRSVEPDAVNLIVNISKKLLGDMVKINPEVIIALIRQGFSSATAVGHNGQVTIRVSEADFAEVSARKEELVSVAGGMAKLDIVCDMSLNITDCIIDTPLGSIDVSLTQQFEALKENLIYLLEHPV